MRPEVAKKLLKVLYYQKYLGVFLVIIGTPIFIFSHGHGSEFPLMIGLFTLYTSLEKIEDERSLTLKTSSLYMAFILGYAIKILTSNLFTNGVIPVHLTEINHFIILVFALAVFIYFPRLYASRN